MQSFGVFLVSGGCEPKRVGDAVRRAHGLAMLSGWGGCGSDGPVASRKRRSISQATSAPGRLLFASRTHIRRAGVLLAGLVLALAGGLAGVRSAAAQSAPVVPPGQAAGGEGGTVERGRSLIPRPVPTVDGRLRPDWFAPPTIDASTSQTRFPLRTVKIQGVTVLPHAQIEALIEPYRGRDVSLAELQALADAITRLYAARGYGLSFAVVPEQDVKDGIVRVVAVEVYIDRVTVEMTQKSAAVIGPRRIRDLLEREASQLKDERPVSIRRIEAMVIALNDLPGVKASVNIRRGARGQGASQLVLSVEATGVAVAASFDNRLRADFGRTEYTVQAAFRSLGIVGDELALAASHSVRGRDFAFYSARYQVPVFQTAVKAYLSASRARSRPTLGGLSLTGFLGEEQAYHVGLLDPVYHTRSTSLNLRLEGAAVDASTNLFGSKVVSNKTRYAEFDADLETADPFGGITQAGLSLEQGINALGAIRRKPGNTLPVTSPGDSTAQYLSARLRLGRSQPVFGFNTAVSVDGQAVLYGVLPSPADCAWGGSGGGQAFDSAALAGDQCVRASGQVSRAFPLSNGMVAAPYVFGDAGWVWHLGQTAVGQHRFERAQSAGFGLNLGLARSVQLSSVVAFPITDDTTPLLRSRSPSVFFSLDLRP